MIVFDPERRYLAFQKFKLFIILCSLVFEFLDVFKFADLETVQFAEEFFGSKISLLFRFLSKLPEFSAFLPDLLPELGFLCTAFTFKPRIDSHHVCTWDSPVGKPRGKASWERHEGKPYRYDAL